METQRERRKMAQNYRKLKRLPINLRKKAIREARNMLGMQKRQQKPKRLKKRKVNSNFERAEHNAMLTATSHELQKILADFEELSDVPYDCTPAELLGKIAIAEGHATKINVQRDGLSTLRIVLHQRSPTIAQLKKAIAAISLAQHKRRQRAELRVLAEDEVPRKQQQVGAPEAEAGEEKRMVGTRVRSSCELVNSALRNGHEHRSVVSWRYLWRCFGLFNVDTNQAIDDNVENGRATLTALGIQNGANLKFVHRVKYFGRRRQT